MQSTGDLSLLADDGHLVGETDVVQDRLQEQTSHADQVVVLLGLEERVSRRVLPNIHGDWSVVADGGGGARIG